jgi:hypothetical protein
MAPKDINFEFQEPLNDPLHEKGSLQM